VEDLREERAFHPLPLLPAYRPVFETQDHPVGAGRTGRYEGYPVSRVYPVLQSPGDAVDKNDFDLLRSKVEPGRQVRSGDFRRKIDPVREGPAPLGENLLQIPESPDFRGSQTITPSPDPPGTGLIAEPAYTWK